VSCRVEGGCSEEQECDRRGAEYSERRAVGVREDLEEEFGRKARGLEKLLRKRSRADGRFGMHLWLVLRMRG
jgi:hypothetical protein